MFLAAGVSIFAFGFTLLLWVLIHFAAYKPDVSVLYFYALLALAGALFGLERWMYHESGGVNPFYDR